LYINVGYFIVVAAINGLTRVVKELDWPLAKIFSNFGEFWRKITSDSQMRWVGEINSKIYAEFGKTSCMININLAAILNGS